MLKSTYNFTTIKDNKHNKLKFSVGTPVYIKTTNAIGFIIDEAGGDYRTDTDGVRSIEELEKFKFSDLARPNVFVPHSVARRIVTTEAARADLHRLYGYDIDRVYPRPVSRRDVIANTERLPCGLLVRHRQDSKFHGFQILQETKVRSAIKADIAQDGKHPANLGVTEDGATIIFSRRWYRNDGIVYGKFKVLTKDTTGFYLGAYNYNESYLKELGHSPDEYKYIMNKITGFAGNYETN